MTIHRLIENNRRWAARLKQSDPDYFKRRAESQTPGYLWIGCSDSRVPANEVIGVEPGEVFVHRNVGNVVVHTDFNCLSVLEFGIEQLKIDEIIVCGHYGCGAVNAAMQNHEYGLIDNWLRHIKDLYVAYQQELEPISDQQQRMDRLCELNVARQVISVCQTTIVQDAWRRGRKLTVHGLIYNIEDGHLMDMGIRINGPDQIAPIYRMLEPHQDASEDARIA
ncbi:MAG TPA: carbonate dehydratase [Mariprofundaceae bacterium]|nr:carbonate dehydratase [Mariprofundaceae bacterium]